MDLMDMPLSDLIPPLTAHDRCDARACDSRAYMAVLLTVETTAPLTFCLHHGREIIPKMQHPFAIRDQSSELTPSFGPSWAGPERCSRIGKGGPW